MSLARVPAPSCSRAAQCLRLALLVLVAAAAAFTPAGADTNSARYKFEGNKWLALDLAIGDVRADTIRFEWPATLMRVKTGYKAMQANDVPSAEGLFSDELKTSMPPERLRESYLHQTTLLAERFDGLGLEDVTRDRETPLEAFGGFVALESERAEELSRLLLAEDVVTDSRGRYLRLGPAPYLSDEQLETAVEHLGRVAR